MARGPRTAAVVLAEEGRAALQRLVRRRRAGQATVMRARIVLAADAEPETTNRALALQLGVSRQSVITWRQRFLLWLGAPVSLCKTHGIRPAHVAKWRE